MAQQTKKKSPPKKKTAGPTKSKPDKQRWQPRPKKARPGQTSKPRGQKSGLSGKHPR